MNLSQSSPKVLGLLMTSCKDRKKTSPGPPGVLEFRIHKGSLNTFQQLLHKQQAHPYLWSSYNWPGLQDGPPLFSTMGPSSSSDSGTELPLQEHFCG